MRRTAAWCVFSGGDGGGEPGDGRRGRRGRTPPTPSLGAGRRGAGPAGTRRGGQRAGQMEGDGAPRAGEPVSGPGPGGGPTRELCRGLGRYRRYLGRLRQNLRDTQSFFRDIEGSRARGRPPSPASAGGPERGPAGDVAEPGLQAGKEAAGGRARGRGAHPPGWPGPGRGPRRREPGRAGGRAVRGRRGAGRGSAGSGADPRRGSRSEFAVGARGSEPQLRDGGEEGWTRGSRRGPREAGEAREL